MPTDKAPEFGKVEKIAGGFRFTEGPVFARRGYLLFSDLPDRIMKWERGKTTVFRENSNRANGLTFDHQGRLLACEANRVTRTEKDGTITSLAEVRGEPNDLIYSIDGSIYFTAPKTGTVYQITRQGKLRSAAGGLKFPNGVALAPNQQALYVADSGGKNVHRFRVAPDGALGEGAVFADVPGVDGLKTDEAGRVWVAGPGGIWVFGTDGRHLGTAKIPEEPSNLNWGEGFRNLYVTARTSVYRLETNTNGTRSY